MAAVVSRCDVFTSNHRLTISRLHTLIHGRVRYCDRIPSTGVEPLLWTNLTRRRATSHRTPGELGASRLGFQPLRGMPRRSVPFCSVNSMAEERGRGGGDGFRYVVASPAIDHEAGTEIPWAGIEPYMRLRPFAQVALSE